MMYLKVDNGVNMETIFSTISHIEMYEMKNKAKALWPGAEIKVTAKSK
tara:strand:+ start:115 stop:258 length:144 start_codon:yes stop_codon:yes gene_type:complete